MELEQLTPAKAAPWGKQQPKRQALPSYLPRREIHHEPRNVARVCGCVLKRIGEDVVEKLDYQPRVFTVERHVRGRWVCARCEALIRTPAAPHIIDKGIPTAGLLARVLGAKYLGHLPLYRQETIFGRGGLVISRSTLAAWVDLRVGWHRGRLPGACQAQVPRDVGQPRQPDRRADPEVLRRVLRGRAGRGRFGSERPRARAPGVLRKVADVFHLWLTAQRQRVPEGSATAKARDYSLKRWPVLTRYIDDADLPANNHWVENLLRPIALGRQNRLIAGSFGAGRRAAAVMSLVHSARRNGHEPHAYLKDVPERLPAHLVSRIAELLPRRWLQTTAS